jgi:transcriptional regulator with XRE-family HTH domain
MAGAKQKSAKTSAIKLVPEPLTTLSNAPPEPSRSLEKALGLQVRLLRREQELSLNELAAAAGISVGMMSKIENGQISPSLSTIRALAEALNTPFTSLFELLGAVLGGDIVVEPYLITLQSDAEAYTGFRHAGTELIYMLTGEVIYRHSEQTFRLKPGDTLLFDSGALHGPETLVKVPMTYLSIIIYPRAR